MDNIYYLLLSSICEFMGFEKVDNPKFSEYLKSLQKNVIELRQSYKNSLVSVDYTSADVQNAYLLAYYPHYINMALDIFKNNAQSINNIIDNYLYSDKKELQVCFFAAGAAPEAVAFCKYINQYCIKKQNRKPSGKLIINTFDMKFDCWASGRFITREKILPAYCNYQYSLIPHKVNLIVPNALEPHATEIKHSHIFFFQNCLNELAKNPETFLNNFTYLLEIAPKNSVIIIADLFNYNVVNQLFNKIEGICNIKNIRVIRSFKDGCVSIFSGFQLPKIITDNLLTGGNSLIPKYKTEINFTIMEVNFQAKDTENEFCSSQLKRFLDYTISLYPRYSEAYFLRGYTHYKLGSNKEAIADFSKAISINPKYVSAYINRGIAYFSSDHSQGAIDDYSQAIRINPKNANAYTNRGIAYYSLGNHQRASQDYKNAFRLYGEQGNADAQKQVSILEKNLSTFG